MKNRLVLEYLSVMFNEKIIRKSEEELYKHILESEVSIKDFYITLRNEGISRQDTLIFAYNIFDKVKSDEEKVKALRLVSDTIQNYGKHFGYKNHNLFMIKVFNEIVVTPYNSSKSLKNIKVLSKLDTIIIEQEAYKIKYHNKNYKGNFNYMELIKLGDEHITDVIAILFKNGKSEMLKAQNRKEYEAVIERLKIEDYDFLLLA